MLIKNVETSKSTVNEMMAGNGAALSMPPAFVFMNPRSHRRYKKANQDKVDGRTKGAKSMLSRIQSRKKMKEELESTISEAVPRSRESAEADQSDEKTEPCKDLQKKRDEAKKKMQSRRKKWTFL